MTTTPNTRSADPSAIWAKLHDLPRSTLAELFAHDATRVDRLTGMLMVPEDAGQDDPRHDDAHQGAAIRFDWSKTHLSPAHLEAFAELATATGYADARDALFAGEVVNITEARAAEHTAERGHGKPTSVEEAEALHERMRGLVEAIHAGALGPVKHLIHIGIGGSALGPALALDALGREGALVDVHVVANVDGAALAAALRRCDPATTLIALASKTFTTIETLTNAQSALAWLAEHGVDDPYGRVIALTAAPERAVAWGVDETRVLPFAPSVGGRYSLWSSIAFPIALALGWESFAALLAGAGAVDAHVLAHDGAANLPLRAAFADLLYARILGAETRAVFAYDERLRLLPAYLQQLEMESNGKSVTLAGAPVSGPTAPVTWGGVGTDAQHAVFQLLHQGTHLVPVDFVAVREPGSELDPAHHRILLTNCFAQGAALMAGRGHADPARTYPGNRPSATILLDALTPASLGALIAFHEHSTFANAVLMGINPFDQFGVELGKEIASAIAAGGVRFDASTEALLAAAGLA